MNPAGLGCALYFHVLDCKERDLRGESPAESTQPGVGSYDPMARYDDGDGVGSNGLTHGPG